MGGLACYLIGVMPKLLYLKYLRSKGKLEKHDEIVLKTVYNCAERFMRIGKVNIIVNGKENIPKDEAVIFAPNHQSIFDIPVMFVSLDKPHGMVAKIQSEKIPGISSWMRQLNCVFMDRDNPRKAVEALNKAAENIENGHSMVIFPEGTRSKDGKIAEFKGGAFRIAKKSGAKIVPVCIDGTRDVYENNGNRVVPGTVYVDILEPIDYSSLSKEEAKFVGDTVRQKIVDVMEKRHNGKQF